MGEVMSKKYTDEQVEEMWKEFRKVPLKRDHRGVSFLARRWKHFAVGTCEMTVMMWFDELHDLGVLYLIYFCR